MSKLRTALFLALPLVVPLAGACKSGHTTSNADHWSFDSVPGRVVKHFTGFRPDRDGKFIDYQYQKKRHVNRTLRRHFANNSANSPFSAEDRSQTSRRPPHSPAPDPLYYMGAESIIIGFALLGVTGTFIPIPIDSVSATVVDDDGWGEFGRGFSEGADAEAKSPQSVNKFRVKNR